MAWAATASALAGFIALGPLHRHPVAALTLLMVAGVGWWGALAAARRRPPRLRWILAGAVVLRLIVLAGQPELSDDVYLYAFEAELLRRGISPYAFAPSDPALDALLAGGGARLAALRSAVGHPEISAAYPPLVQYYGWAVNSLVHALGVETLAGTVFVFRLAATCADLAVLVPLARLLHRCGHPRHLLIAWAWSPLVAIEFAGSAHFDALGILLWLTGLLALLGRRPQGSAVLFASGALVKLLPVVSLLSMRAPSTPGPRAPSGASAAPVLTRSAWWVAGAVAVASLVPLIPLHGGLDGLIDGIGQYGLWWSSTSLVYGWVEPVLAVPIERATGGAPWARAVGAGLARALMIGAWLALWLWTRRRRLDPVATAACCVGGFLVLTPTLHPWYVTWMLPFAALSSNPARAWLWLAAAAPLLYSVLPGWHRDGIWVAPTWLWPVIALPFFCMLWIDLGEARLRGRSEAPGPEA